MVLLDVSLNVSPLLPHWKGSIRETVTCRSQEEHAFKRAGNSADSQEKSWWDYTSVHMQEPGQDDNKERITMEAQVLPWQDNAMFLNCGTGILSFNQDNRMTAKGDADIIETISFSKDACDMKYHSCLRYRVKTEAATSAACSRQTGNLLTSIHALLLFNLYHGSWSTIITSTLQLGKLRLRKDEVYSSLQN